MPAGDDRAVEIAGDGDDAQPAPDDEEVEEQQDRAADEAALLGERRERRSRSRARGGSRDGSGSPPSTPRPSSPPAPIAVIDCVTLYVSAARVGVGVREPGEPLDLVRLQHLDARRRAGARGRRARRRARPTRRAARGAASGRRRRTARRRAPPRRRAPCRGRAAGRRAASARAPSPIAARIVRELADRAAAARRGSRRCARTNSTLPNSEGWNWNGPMSIQRFEPRIASANAKTNDHQADRRPVDRPSSTARQRSSGMSERDDEPDDADGGGDRLPDDEVVRVAGHVEARDPADRPQAVADERARRRAGAPSRAGGGDRRASRLDARRAARAERPASAIISPSSRADGGSALHAEELLEDLERRRRRRRRRRGRRSR